MPNKRSGLGDRSGWLCTDSPSQYALRSPPPLLISSHIASSSSSLYEIIPFSKDNILAFDLHVDRHRRSGGRHRLHPDHEAQAVRKHRASVPRVIWTVSALPSQLCGMNGIRGRMGNHSSRPPGCLVIASMVVSLGVTVHRAADARISFGNTSIRFMEKHCLSIGSTSLGAEQLWTTSPPDAVADGTQVFDGTDMKKPVEQCDERSCWARRPGYHADDILAILILLNGDQRNPRNLPLPCSDEADKIGTLKPGGFRANDGVSYRCLYCVLPASMSGYGKAVSSTEKPSSAI
ncbi:hypothetical protein M422DRAFT_259199 [Sphaerobolus stellatus SS14]|uniref:Uncharacterized protein n=1 Tax=Sphaerobolus stellatus (strain SS14) TaxID=990650 RepID=A0A0C9V9T6_SPHS4|nr:hypothetical protein M422DRAFT_259199 [Sphaerobolus stellatus SS14]